MFPVFKDEITAGLKHVNKTHPGGGFMLNNVLADIEMRRNDLFAYRHFEGCPSNTNLIELYNSHLNGRLKTSPSSYQKDQAVIVIRWLCCHRVHLKDFKTVLPECSYEVPFV